MIDVHIRQRVKQGTVADTFPTAIVRSDCADPAQMRLEVRAGALLLGACVQARLGDRTVEVRVTGSQVYLAPSLEESGRLGELEEELEEAAQRAIRLLPEVLRDLPL